MILLGINDLARREQARELLAWGAERYWGLSPLPQIAAGERGKPWFPACPQRHFNLSHSGKLALCALADGEVGVDIQEMRAAWRPSLVERTCRPEERAWLASLGDRGEDFAQLWALKESAGKQTGYGLPYPPSRQAVPVPLLGEPYDPGQIYTLGEIQFRIYLGENWRGAACGLEVPPQEIQWVSGLGKEINPLQGEENLL